MKVAVIGAGFVGLTHSVVLAELGHRVRVFDIDSEKIDAYRSGQSSRIERHVNEPGLSDHLRGTLGRELEFFSEPAGLIDGVEAIFLCLPTPGGPGGATDCRAYERAVHEVAAMLGERCDRRRCVVVNKSTVPIGTARMTELILRAHRVDHAGVAANPEFLPQGGALRAALDPDRIVVGAERLEDREILRKVYRPLVRRVGVRYIETTPETAEAIKYVSNSLLFTYVSFWNGVAARLAEAHPDLCIDDLKRGVLADSRISPWGSYVGVGAGGSCFGKDIRSLIDQLERDGHPADLLRAVDRINEHQKTYLIDRAIAEAGFEFSHKTIAVLGMAFKRNTNDMRESSALRAVETMLALGARGIRAYDPLASQAARARFFHPSKNPLFERISYHDTARDAIRGSDALYIATDHEEFRGLAATICETVQPPYLIIDGRRIIAGGSILRERGYDCLDVGAPLQRAEAIDSMGAKLESFGG